LPTGKTTLQIWQSDQWKNYEIEKTFFPSSAEVDFAVLETKEQVKQPFGILPSGQQDPSERATLGQQVWFLGYPFGDPALMSHFLDRKDMLIPFIKRGTMSAIDASRPDAVVLYIDGFNNPGFSGGPIVYWDFGNVCTGLPG
jgi:hypothetical protein